MTASASASASATAAAAAARNEESHVGDRVNRKKNNTRLVTRVANVRKPLRLLRPDFVFASRLALSHRPARIDRKG